MIVPSIFFNFSIQSEYKKTSDMKKNSTEEYLPSAYIREPLMNLFGSFRAASQQWSRTEPNQWTVTRTVFNQTLLILSTVEAHTITAVSAASLLPLGLILVCLIFSSFRTKAMKLWEYIIIIANQIDLIVALHKNKKKMNIYLLRWSSNVSGYGKIVTNFC